MKFGENLKLLRKERKLSQEELAEKVNVSRQSVSKWETGDAYPEMNNILELCKIFHVQINDLVHEDMSDINSLDKEIIMSVVKLKQEKQDKVKGLSKAISLLAKIGQIISIISIVILVMSVIGAPLLLHNININDKEVNIFNESIPYLIEEDKLIINFDGFNETINSNEGSQETIYILNKIKDNKILFIVLIEIVFLLSIISLVLLRYALKHLEKLFNNINAGDTPFTLENVEHIKQIAIFMILMIILPNILGLLAEICTGQSFGVGLELLDIIYILFLFSMAYIFEYGYEIQKDSKGVMYSKE